MCSRIICRAAVLAVVLEACSSIARADLFFSEYIEGSSNNKALEIYNNSTVAADLTGWTIQMFFNGSASAGLTIPLSGFIAPSDVYVVAQASASPAILAQADLTSAGSWFNGDDAITLNFGTTIVDSIGQVGFDPGSQWSAGGVSTLDRTMVRMSSVSMGDNNATDVFDPSVQWNGFPNDTFANLGTHTFTGTTTPPGFTHALPAAAQTTEIDFNTFAGTGFAVNPALGQLDSDNFRATGLSDGSTAFGGEGTTGDFARGLSTGGETTGGIYAFEIAAGDRALGVQPIGTDFNPGSIFVRLPNETTEVIDEIEFSVDLLYNNDQPRSNSLSVAYSTDDIAYVNIDTITSPETADALGFQSFNITQTLAGLGIAPGEFLYLRFTGVDVSGSGNRDEFAIDNLTFFQPQAQAVPEPAGLVGWVVALGVCCGAATRRYRRRQSPI